MKRFIFFLLVLAGSLAALTSFPTRAGTLPSVAPKASCASLQSFDPHLSDMSTSITEAMEATVNGVAVCQIRGVVAPSIRFEVRLPLAGWTQRYLQTGCGGLCGNLKIESPQRDCPAIQRGEFAMASTDMGHEGMGGQFGADPQLRIDFAHRGVHATALVAKALIRQFYGQVPRWSYFSGCSDGGREALMEAQRYPGDFDGIAAGAPAANFLVQNTFYHAWNARTQLGDHPAAIGPLPPMRAGGPPSGLGPQRGTDHGGMMPPGGFPGAPVQPTALAASDLPVLHAGALGACDAIDGVKDGIISDPLACRFDPHVVECREGATENCLSKTAADAAADIYRGAHDRLGRKLVIGALMPGSELSWSMVFVPGRAGGPVMSAIFATDTIQWLAFPKPLASGWTLGDFSFSTDTMLALAPMHALYDATDPDLGRFQARGGKLIMWHGWSDPHISPANSIAYYQAVNVTMGAKAGDVLRLFVVPGMYHCGSGDGMTSIDVITPLMAWTEDGKAPEQLVAARSDADAIAGKGRPVYAWPQVATLRPGADPEVPSNWARAQPTAALPTLYKNWEGAYLFAPGFHKDCKNENGVLTCETVH